MCLVWVAFKVKIALEVEWKRKDRIEQGDGFGGSAFL